MKNVLKKIWKFKILKKFEVEKTNFVIQKLKKTNLWMIQLLAWCLHNSHQTF